MINLISHANWTVQGSWKAQDCESDEVNITESAMLVEQRPSLGSGRAPQQTGGHFHHC